MDLSFFLIYEGKIYFVEEFFIFWLGHLSWLILEYGIYFDIEAKLMSKGLWIIWGTCYCSNLIKMIKGRPGMFVGNNLNMRGVSLFINGFLYSSIGNKIWRTERICILYRNGLWKWGTGNGIVFRAVWGILWEAEKSKWLIYLEDLTVN